MSYASLVLPFTLAFTAMTFAISAVGKLTAFNSFQSTLSQLAIPKEYTPHAATAILAAEMLILAAMPLGRIGATFSLVLAICLLCVFSIALPRMARMGTPCNCFGSRGIPTSKMHILRNLGLIAVCAAGLAGEVLIVHPNLPAPVIVLTVAAGCFVALIWSQLPEIGQLLIVDNRSAHTSRGEST